MRHSTNARSRPLCKTLLTCLSLAALAAGAQGATLTLKDGRVLTGRTAQISGVAENPLLEGGGKKGAEPVGLTLVQMIDDDLTRTMISKHQIANANEAGTTPLVQVKVAQNVAHTGQQIASVGPIKEGPFDDFGRRTVTMTLAKGPITVMQGITVITPLWTKVEGLNSNALGSYVWDMRIATSSIPRETLSRILANTNGKGKDKPDLNDRLQVVKLLLQSERFKEAENELELVLHDFPNVQALATELATLRKLAAKRILSEVEMRRSAGQHDLVLKMLQQFPTDNVPGEILQEVQKQLVAYKAIQADIQGLNDLIAGQMTLVGVELPKPMAAVCAEIKAELSFNNLPRLAPFKRLVTDPSLSAEQKLSLAITGWLLGADDATEDVKACNQLIEIRGLARRFFNERKAPTRDKLLAQIKEQPYATPRMVAKLVAAMKPVRETEAPPTPGFYELVVPGAPEEPQITYYVQLPPEYDPFRTYPTIVTLNASFTTPQMQIDWWAGPVDSKTKSRSLGQASRQGYIVIAPAWSTAHQAHYEYSAREHAAVLNTLRDASRRFSIDTDHVYLSGHSMGGDAAWDIGLAHPDLWAGVIPIVATTGKYIPQYDGNAKNAHFYFVCGELDGDRMVRNALDFDRYLSRDGYDTTVVEYIGRGHENFSDEVLRIFDWMGRKRRDFFPKEFTMATMRPWDNFFWWIETRDMPAKTMVDPGNWPPPANTQHMSIKGTLLTNSNVTANARGSKVTLWLSPEMVDFESGKPIRVMVNGGPSGGKATTIEPNLKVLLDDVRTRGDRKHPFWAKIE